ncbi:MAG: hypothetical protein QF568_04125 [Flavobacteriales bacterium]|jgi:hypothetical protein|nr:hypothetical protein [Flavobacteriales bacterium]|tara:strand:- start:50 stop:955 length:906 start_codon:yes stop_codon:yes gene_type:complete
MDILNDICIGKKEIIDIIKKYGSVREHNYWFFYNQQTDYAKVFFLKFKDSGILTIRYKSGVWELIGEVLAPEKKRLELFNEFLDYVLLTKKDKKVFVFVPEKFYNGINSMLQKSDKYRITRAPDVYNTPVFNMKEWNKNLEGGNWKKLRNIKNKFSKIYNVEFIPSKEIDKKKLMGVVNCWRKNRTKVEKNYYTEMYLNFIKNDFEGTDMARSVVVNNEPCTITAGWKIPNSNNYYSAIGLYNYKYGGLGEIANIDDLTQIKKEKYEYADFGDSTESLLQFKKKFGPQHFYRTYWFHIVKK